MEMNFHKWTSVGDIEFNTKLKLTKMVGFGETIRCFTIVGRLNAKRDG